MKTWEVTQYGEPEEMSLTERPAPAPGPGEVLIRNRAAAINFFDILQIQGKYQFKPSFPFTPGGESAGVVTAVGEGVVELKPGDRVASAPRGGCYADYVVTRADRTFPIPVEMSFEQAAAMPIVYQTSLFALRERGRLQAGEWLLVNAGASGVGVAAIELGKAFGARVIATAGSEEKLAFCREHGADHALSYNDPAWYEQVKSIAGGYGVDAVCDVVGGDVFDLSTKCIAPGGRLLVVGFTSGRIPSIPANRILLKNIGVVGVFWGRHCDENPAFPGQAHGDLIALWQQGKIHPAGTQTYPIEQAREALADLAARKILGKAVLTMNEGL